MPAMKKAPQQKKTAAKKSRPKPSAPKRSATAKSATPRSPSRTVMARRADYGAPIDGFFAKQPSHLREILEALRALVEEVAPDATAAIKWGMPFYTVGGGMMCALGGHKSHVNLVLAGTPGSFADPDGRLEGEGKTGRHLTLRSLGELPREAVRSWLRTAAQLARAKN